MKKSNIQYSTAWAALSAVAVIAIAPTMAGATETALTASTDALSTAAQGVHDIVDSVAFRAMLALVAGALGSVALIRGPSAATIGGALGAGGAAVWAPDVMLTLAGTALLQ